MRLLNILFGAVAIVFLVLYVRASDAGAARAPEGAPRVSQAGTSNEEYVFIGVSTSNPYWVDHRRAFEDRGRLLGVRTTFTGPAGSDIREQVSSVENAIARKVKGIMIAPADPDALAPVINKAIEAGIVVVTSDTDSPRSKRYTFIGTGNYEAGLAGGKIMAKLIGGKGKVGFLTVPGQWNLEERVRGYKDAFKESPGISIGPIGTDDGDPAKASAAAKNMIQANPDLVGIAGVDAAGAAGAAIAVREAGKKDAIKIVGMDRNEQTLDEMAGGYVHATLVQRTYAMAIVGFSMMYDLVHGQYRMGKDWTKTGFDPLPKLVDTGVVVVTPETAPLFRD
jgi:ribose transport system substrate-binding protein